MFKLVGDRLTIASGVLITSLITTVSGIVMVFLQIQDTGSIDLQTPFINGTVKSGFVGITLIFLGIVLAIFSLITVSKREMEVKADGVFVKCRGSFSRKAMFEALSTLKSLEEDKQN